MKHILENPALEHIYTFVDTQHNRTFKYYRLANEFYVERTTSKFHDIRKTSVIDAMDMCSDLDDKNYEKFFGRKT